MLKKRLTNVYSHKDKIFFDDAKILFVVNWRGKSSISRGFIRRIVFRSTNLLYRSTFNGSSLALIRYQNKIHYLISRSCLEFIQNFILRKLMCNFIFHPCTFLWGINNTLNYLVYLFLDDCEFLFDAKAGLFPSRFNSL